MKSRKSRVAIVYSSGALHSTADEVQARLLELSEHNFDCVHLPPQNHSENGYTAGTVTERATQLSFALTTRKFSNLWAARGGFGATEIIPALERMLPPVIPLKKLFGFSDVSGIGIYLACRFPNFSYIHANHAFDKNLFSEGASDRQILFSLLKGERVDDLLFTASSVFGRTHLSTGSISGPCVPLNLSLAESLACLRQVTLPKNNILFLEDIEEDVYRLLRKFDSLVNSQFLQNTRAIILGTFTKCLNSKNELASIAEIALLFSQKIDIPVLVLPMFGHDKMRLPLVFNSPTSIHFGHSKTEISISFRPAESNKIATSFPANLYLPPANCRLHFTGIGGTGMAAVAGLFKTSGFSVTGSDGPIYPPMDKVLSELGIVPAVGYTKENILETSPDVVILSNAMTRQNAELKKNAELEHLLQTHLPIFSFPSALRQFFLRDSFNIVVSGTHGKTTTTSLIAHALTQLGARPSFLIGGTPLNFTSGFSIQNKGLFVLEGDEYDSAFFDKGPKFLHYEPSIAILNNIEFDHADIYDNIEAIEDEFRLLAQMTLERGGVVVANLSDPRVLRIALQCQGNIVGFSENAVDSNFSTWKLEGFKTLESGILVTLKSPTGAEFNIKSEVFGKHNAMNIAAAFATLQAYQSLGQKIENFDKWSKAFSNFKGVKRRFELVSLSHNVAIFDDFAHHPTAIKTTISAFKDYAAATGRKGRLIVCFDPRNATMRRSILSTELAQSFAQADLVFLGKVPRDLRLKPEESLDGFAVAQSCGTKAR